MQITAFSFTENRFVKLGSRNKNAGSTRIKVATLTLLFLLLSAGSAALVHAETPVFTLKWGGRGSGDGQFEQPYAVAVDSSGNVYVADSGNNRVQKFSSTGMYQTQWGSYGSGDGQFYNPCGVAVDGSGNVYVVDTYNNRVQKFSSTGVYQTKLGSQGDGDGQFDLAYGFAVDGSGNLYVADTMNHRIQKFAAPTSPPKGPCIIATATYGGPLASEVVFMRSVRDDLIGSSPTGSILVNAWNSFYYSWSPPVASAIAGSGGLKTLFSALLSPLLGSMYIVAGVYNSLAWLSPDLAAVVSFMAAAALSISIYILLPALAIRYGVKFVRNSWKRPNNRSLSA